MRIIQAKIYKWVLNHHMVFWSFLQKLLKNRFLYSLKIILNIFVFGFHCSIGNDGGRVKRGGKTRPPHTSLSLSFKEQEKKKASWPQKEKGNAQLIKWFVIGHEAVGYKKKRLSQLFPVQLLNLYQKNMLIRFFNLVPSNKPFWNSNYGTIPCFPNL